MTELAVFHDDEDKVIVRVVRYSEKIPDLTDSSRTPLDGRPITRSWIPWRRRT